MASTTSIQPKKLTLFGNFASAATAACTAALFTNPMEVVKTRLQLDGEGGKQKLPRQYNGILDAVKKIGRLEGLRGLQAGLVPALAYQTAMNGARLGLYHPLQEVIVGATGADPTSTPMKMACGALSGAVGATLGSPLYLIKSRLQAQSAHFNVLEVHQYNGMVDGLRKVWASGGLRELFRGLDGAVPRVMTGSAVQLSSYDFFKREVEAAGVPPGMPAHLAGSLCASLLTVTCMNPLDVISTRLYQSAGKATQYSGPLDCGLKTVRAEGIMALQKGWLAQYARLGPHTVLTFVFLEQVRPVYQSMSAFVE